MTSLALSFLLLCATGMSAADESLVLAEFEFFPNATAVTFILHQDFLAGQNERGEEKFDLATDEGVIKAAHAYLAGAATIKLDGIIAHLEFQDCEVNPPGITMRYRQGGLNRVRTADITWRDFDGVSGVPVVFRDSLGELRGIMTRENKRVSWDLPPALLAKETPAPSADMGLRASVPVLSFLLLGIAGVVWILVPQRCGERAACYAGVALCFVAVLASETRVAESEMSFSPGELSADWPATISGLLHRIYRAQEESRDPVAYDWLTGALTEERLAGEYLEMVRAIKTQTRSGARVKVDTINVESAEVRLSGLTEAVLDCRWKVSGVIGHWGHVHRRHNEYEARMTLRRTPSGWRIADIVVLREERILPEVEASL